MQHWMLENRFHRSYMAEHLSGKWKDRWFDSSLWCWFFHAQSVISGSSGRLKTESSTEKPMGHLIQSKVSRTRKEKPDVELRLLGSIRRIVMWKTGKCFFCTSTNSWGILVWNCILHEGVKHTQTHTHRAVHRSHSEINTPLINALYIA